MKLDELRTLIRAPFPGCGTYSNRLVHLLLTVCELFLHNPGIPTAVVDAETFDSVAERPECSDLAQESLSEVFHSSGGH
jgi:hypothetical protein